MNFRFSSFHASNFAFFLRIFDEILSGFRDKFQKRVTCVAFSIKFAKTDEKIAENSEICENYSLLFINPKSLGGPASGSSKITAFSYIQPSEPFLDLLTPASFTGKMRVLSQKRDACEILDLSAVT